MKPTNRPLNDLLLEAKRREADHWQEMEDAVKWPWWVTLLIVAVPWILFSLVWEIMC